MKKIYPCVRFLFFTGIFFAVLAMAEASFAGENVKIFIDGYNPPNMYLRNGKPAGLYADIYEGIAKRMGEPVELAAGPWKRGVADGIDGKIGIGGFYKTPERIELFDYSEEVYRELLLIFVKRGRQFEFKSVSDLAGKKVGVILGWSYGDEFDSARMMGLFQVEPVNRDALNFKKLYDGRLDCVVASQESGLYQIAKEKMVGIYPLNKALLANPTYVVFAKKAGKRDFLRRFNNALKQMKKDGEYDRIVAESQKRELGSVLKTLEVLPSLRGGE